MNILLIGSGGREHAIAIKLKESKNIKKLFCAPGNPGTAQVCENLNIDISNHDEIVKFCQENRIDLVVVGPEKPLTEGLADSLISNGINVFGPSKEAAQIEGKKSFAKELMKSSKVPTADFAIFNKDEYPICVSYLEKISYPVVIKADGIAAGKGVMIAENLDEAIEAVKSCFIESKFGDAGNTVVVEEFMNGIEASVFAICDGSDFILLPAAQDHKRIFDNDEGKNTGGMGAYAPTPFVSEDILTETSEKVITPILKAMKELGMPFVGTLYAGLMITNQGVKVVEFNCRFGDPETQVVLPLLEGDFAELLFSAASGKINKNAVQYNGGSAICVVLASKGYPDSYEKGKVITIGEDLDFSTTTVLHAGTKLDGTKLVSEGGRVLNVVTQIKSNDLKLCKQKIYNEISKIHFDGMQYRKDISDKGIKVLSN